MENKTQMKFPIISIIEDEMVVFEKPEFYFVCPKDYISKLNKIDEQIIDSNGNLYKRGTVIFDKYINIFGGFSLRFARFGICFVEKNVQLIKKLELSDIILIIDKHMPSDEVKGDDSKFNNINDALKYLFSIL